MSLVTRKPHIYYFPGCRRIPERSLLDRCLIACAQDSDQESLTCRSDFTDLPVHLIQYLLSYIAAHRARGISIGELQKFLGEREKDLESDCRSRCADLRHLDLSGSIGSTVTFDELNGIFAGSVSSCVMSLTHLCLARPGPNVSWPSFLSFALQVPCLTHLSLAYWTVPIGGWSTVVPVLSQLSYVLTNLQYLDVEGCTDWVHVLAMDGVVGWTGGWKNVHSLNLSQGPMPIEVQFEGGPETSNWVRGELEARKVEESINGSRKGHGLNLPPVQVEHGWNPKNSFLKSVIETAWEQDEQG